MVVSTPMAVDESKPKKKVRRGGVKHKSKTLPQKSVADDSEMTLEPLDAEVPETAPEQRWDNEDDGDDEIMIDNDAVAAPQDAPAFPPLSANAQRGPTKSEIRRIPIPPHRMTPLKKDWVNIFSPLAELCGLQVRMNTQRRAVEIRTSKHSKEVSALQKGADFVKAYALGFDVNDAIALLRMDDLYLDSFEIKDVKTLHGDHLARAIGRIAGQDGRTKFTIENASRTRVVLADTKIHILGSFQNIKIARDAIVSLILGSPPGKVYAGLRTVGSRLRQRAM
ncbi:eukaryotic type KH-domain (KH-domain type I) [Sistotremastrum niveocremeum HHB9708]|uniref:Pre-rRNA-processing protein PNO1 n=1 Tax=Sistotremastrum niveocremeum HHB9708 TaxID=1314777 RepID=A0A164P5S8_9AGAM|nr:eukaryotic type KH-domain (KH-domain type I) [Sistotremastrum niveocremeum HHB9708]